jgi:hypothetical protein
MRRLCEEAQRDYGRRERKAVEPYGETANM